MGRQADQNAFSTTHRPEAVSQASLSQSRAAAPTLPPRQPFTAFPPLDAPPPYTEAAPTYHSQPITESWSAQDPRSTSTQSLVPDGQSTDKNKRRLLLIWIHGFMGNETSFQSFPAHVHNALCQRLQEREGSNYVVHTKIYPRYKSRNKIEVARDIFSDWLAPHEDADTDIILLGHSLGGILSAEVVLKPALGEHRGYRHRILGTIDFDTPFLGMHPGVISSGLSSLFRPTTDSPTDSLAPNTGANSPQLVATRTNSNVPPSNNETLLEASSSRSSDRPTDLLSSTNSYSTTSSGPPLDLALHDPNYDPPYKNDVRQIQRSGWSNVWHFVQKHADGQTLVAKSNALFHAIKSYVTSHAEFGGCLADIKGLRVRYKTLRELEDKKGDERVRFVNYYTACTGRPRKRSPSPLRAEVAQEDQIEGLAAAAERDLRNMQLQSPDEDAVSSKSNLSVVETTDHEDKLTLRSAENQSLGSKSTEDKEGGTKSDASSMICVSPAPTDDSDNEHERTITPSHMSKKNPSSDEDHTIRPDPSPSPSSETPPQPTHPALPLPPIPAPSTTPPPFDPTLYPDKATLKVAEKDHARLLKQHARALKDRDRAIKDRQKLLKKRESAAEKARAKAQKTAEKEKEKENDQASGELERLKGEQARMDREARRLNGEDDDDAAAPSTTPISTLSTTTTTTTTDSPPDPPISTPPTPPPPHKKNRTRTRKPSPPPSDKVFCILPSSSLSPYPAPRDARGERMPDKCWVRVFMPGVDEVGAHCGLFFVDGPDGNRERYEWFVGEVAGRVEGWVL